MGLLAQEDLFGSLDVERKWALILHGIALMTPNGGNDGEVRTAHDGQMPVGRALYLGVPKRLGNKDSTAKPVSSGCWPHGVEMTRTLLARAFRMLAAANVTFSWREMGNFIRSDGFNEEATERHRHRIASEYFQAQYRPQT